MEPLGGAPADESPDERHVDLHLALGGPLAGQRVLLGVTGGISAYKAVLLARLLVADGVAVDPILTASASRFVGAATFEGITGRPARHEVWEDVPGGTHVAAGRAADVAIVYPATAHTIARLAAGLADDLLTTTLLAASCPLVVAPAMHTEMWYHPATQDNVARLRARGVHLLGPADGALMGGDEGPGRLVEPQEAFALLQELAAANDPGASADREHAHRSTADREHGHLEVAGSRTADDLRGRHVLVTAGGTREPIDPVRFLGNRSSGRMGYAIAAAAAARGASVTLISGPTHLAVPDGVERIEVTTAVQMREAVLAEVDQADLVVKSAAVADFRPADEAAQKVKKDPDDPHAAPTIRLVRTPDILAELGQRRGTATRPVLIGFAAETEDVEANGRAKLERKGVDLLVVNDVSADDAGFEVETNRVVLLDRHGGRYELGLASKTVIADQVLDAAVEQLTATDPSSSPSA